MTGEGCASASALANPVGSVETWKCMQAVITQQLISNSWKSDSKGIKSPEKGGIKTKPSVARIRFTYCSVLILGGGGQALVCEHIISSYAKWWGLSIRGTLQTHRCQMHIAWAALHLWTGKLICIFHPARAHIIQQGLTISVEVTLPCYGRSVPWLLVEWFFWGLSGIFINGKLSSCILTWGFKMELSFLIILSILVSVCVHAYVSLCSAYFCIVTLSQVCFFLCYVIWSPLFWSEDFLSVLMIPGFLPVFKNEPVSMCWMGATLKKMTGPLIRETPIASSGHSSWVSCISQERPFQSPAWKEGGSESHDEKNTGRAH